MADNKNTINEVIRSLVSGMDGYLSTKSVVGEPTKVGDAIIVPFMDVSFGVGAGGKSTEKNDETNACGLTGKMTSSAVLIISNGTTRLVNIRNQDNVGKLLDMIPDLVNKAAAKKNIEISDEEAVACVTDNE